jgi:hypothetical protein
MLPLPEGIIAVLGSFAPLFSRPVWRHVRVLVVGALLCQGARTVTAALRVMGLKGEKRKGQVSSRPEPRALVRLDGCPNAPGASGGPAASRVADTGWD